MANIRLSKSDNITVPVWPVTKKDVPQLAESVGPRAEKIATASGFSGQRGEVLVIQGENGDLESVLYGLGETPNALDSGKLPRQLPEGNYHLAGRWDDVGDDSHFAALGWCLGAYRYEKYKKSSVKDVRLKLSDTVDRERLEREVDAHFLARDLINTPANDLGPEELEDAIRHLAKTHDASVNVVKGDELLEANFPMIHAVGRASLSAPRLVVMVWGQEDAPKVTLVGKGVIFDTGGLNIKPGSSMALMKKDMGGAANVLALASMIMSARLPVRLRVLVPAVENAISGNAFRPGDILQTRKGITVEIGNTDAEGRLILGDALTLGDEDSPEMMIDMATLTGAARVALGPDLPPFYTDDDELAGLLTEAGVSQHDPLWRMPLWPPYRDMLKSSIADINHISTTGFAGSVTAALFLSKFVENAKSWAHFDIFGWVPKEKPWAEVGGEAQCIRALFDVISKRYPAG